MRNLLLASAVIALGASCSIRDSIVLSVVGENEQYLWRDEYQGTSLDVVADGVWSFRWTWYRNLVVKTDEGWFVTDPFNPHAAGELKKALDHVAPGLPVHTLFLTHYHLDHVRGGAALGANHVLAHEDCPVFWSELHAADVAPLTEPIDGDKKLTIGGVDIELLQLPHSHGGDTLYAVYLPKQKILHTADLGMVKAIPPVGIPDAYLPGYLRALDRVATLDFDRWVPSHFGLGTKPDLIDSTTMIRTLGRLVREATEQHRAPDGNVPDDAATLKARYRYVNDRMKERYGGWLGYDQMILFFIVRGSTGELLGF